MSVSYYCLLNIATNATQSDIKIAYRKLAQKHHPDVNTSGNDELIKQINHAYEILSNPRKKEIYDQQLVKNIASINKNLQKKRGYSPHRYYKNSVSGTTYFFSTKTKLQGLFAVILVVLIIWIGIKKMDYYAANYYYEQAELAKENKAYLKAFKLYHLAIRDFGSKNAQALIRIVELNRLMNLFVAMVDNAELGLSYSTDSTEIARLYYLKGIGLFNTKKYQEAERAFKKSLHFKYNKDSIYKKIAPIKLILTQKYFSKASQ